MKATKLLAVIFLAFATIFGCAEDFSDDIDGLNSAIALLNEQLTEMSELTEQQQSAIDDYKTQIAQLNSDLDSARSDAEKAKESAEQSKQEVEKAKELLENSESSASGDRIIYPKIDLSDGGSFVSSQPYDSLLKSFCEFSDILDSSCDDTHSDCKNHLTCCIGDYHQNDFQIFYSATALDNYDFVPEDKILTTFIIVNNNDFENKERVGRIGLDICNGDFDCEQLVTRINNDSENNIYIIVRITDKSSPRLNLANVNVGDILRSKYLTYKAEEVYFISETVAPEQIKIVKTKLIDNNNYTDLFVCQLTYSLGGKQ